MIVVFIVDAFFITSFTLIIAALAYLVHSLDSSCSGYYCACLCWFYICVTTLVPTVFAISCLSLATVIATL